MLGVAAVHTAFAAVVLQEPLRALVARGVVDAVGDDPTLNGVTWFVFFGGALALAGLAIDALERLGAAPRAAGVALLAMTAIGVILMPLSGLWLIAPPALSLAWPRPRG
ncbi:MAG: hypothetical protein IAE78_31540 [Myxococcus sp.]|nr:hypothetical protein [Myxococcus sp.]